MYVMMIVDGLHIIFINNENSLVSSGYDNISINDVCSRCENQYKYNCGF